MDYDQSSGMKRDTLKDELKALAGSPLARQLLNLMENQRPDRTDMLIDELHRQAGEEILK